MLVAGLGFDFVVERVTDNVCVCETVTVTAVARAHGVHLMGRPQGRRATQASKGGGQHCLGRARGANASGERACVCAGGGAAAAVTACARLTRGTGVVHCQWWWHVHVHVVWQEWASIDCGVVFASRQVVILHTWVSYPGDWKHNICA